MAKSNIKRKSSGFINKVVKQHPYKTFLHFTLLGIALLFLFCIVAFQITKTPDFVLPQFKFPKAFVVSTFILMLSSITLSNITYLYDNDKITSIKDNLLITLILGVSFMISQFVGWKELTGNGINLQGYVSGSYLYVISGLHVLHLFGGIIFVYVEIIRVWQKSKDPVKSLIYFTDPYQKLKLELIRTYWNFMDILWVGIFFYFLFSF